LRCFDYGVEIKVVVSAAESCEADKNGPLGVFAGNSSFVIDDPIDCNGSTIRKTEQLAFEFESID
jgi:hypothetical protein